MNFAPAPGYSMEARCRVYNQALHGLGGALTIEINMATYRKSVRTRVINQLKAGIRTTNDYRAITGGLLSVLEEIYDFKLPLNAMTYSPTVDIPKEYREEARVLFERMNMECALIATPNAARATNGQWVYLNGDRMYFRPVPAQYRESTLFSRLGPLMRKCMDGRTLEAIDKSIKLLETAGSVTFKARMEFVG